MIRENYYHLEEVSNKIILSQNFPVIHYTRLNLHYEPIHKFCKLILNNLSISERTGQNAFSSFLLDMNVLFERFIYKIILELTSKIKEITIMAKERSSLDNEGNISLEPDILIVKNDIPLLVLDTKYKKMDEVEIKNFDIYQILAYCKGFNLNKAVLLYPEWECVRKDTVKIKNSEIEIRIMTINLAGDKQTFETNCINLVKEVMDFAGISVEPYSLVIG